MNNILNEKHSIYILNPNITKGLIMCIGILIPKLKEWVWNIVLDQGNIDFKPLISTKEP
jgi:hypothetical protein